MSDLKPTIYLKVKKSLRSTKGGSLPTEWVKLKKNKKDARRKLNQARKNAAIKPSIFGGRKTLYGKLIKRPYKAYNRVIRRGLAAGVIKNLSFFGTTQAVNNTLFGWSRVGRLIKKRNPTKYRLYRKEIPYRPNAFELNPMLSVLKKLARHNTKKQHTRRLILFNRYLNTRASSYFRSYLPASLSSMDGVINTSRDSLVKERETKNALLIKPLFQDVKFRKLLIKMSKIGVRGRSLTKVLTLALNPFLINFINNKSDLIASNDLISNHFSAIQASRTRVNFNFSKYSNIGYFWVRTSGPFYYTNSLSPYVGTFWDNLNFNSLNHSYGLTSVSMTHYSELVNFCQNNTLFDFVNLNLMKSFPHKSYVFNTLAKTAMMNEVLASPHYNPNHSKFIMQTWCRGFNHYSCFSTDGKLSRSLKNLKLATGSTLDSYFKKTSLLANTSLKDDRILLVTSKTPSFLIATNPGSVSVQLRINQEYDDYEERVLNDVTLKCPTVFTLKLDITEYLSEQMFTTYSNNHTSNNFVKYHYTDTSEPTINLHTANNFIQTPFLINWNDDISENLIYLQTAPSTGSRSIDDKLIAVLSSVRGQSISDFVDTTEDVSSVYSLDKDLSELNVLSLFDQIGRYVNLKNVKNKKCRKLFGFVDLLIKNFITKTGTLRNPNSIVELLRGGVSVHPDLVNILNVIRRRFGLRGRVSKYNPHFSAFLLKSCYKAWLSVSTSRRLKKLDNIKRKKRYLLFNKKKNRKRSSRFYNKIVRKESAPIKKQLEHGSRTFKKRSYLKRYLGYATMSRWARNPDFYLKNFSVVQKNRRLNQLEIFETEPLDMISEFDEYVDEFKSLSLTQNFRDFNDDSEIAASDYIAWLIDYRTRNTNHSSLNRKTELRKSYNVTTLSHKSFSPHYNQQTSDLTSYLTSNTFFLNTTLTNQFLFKYLILRSAEYHNYSHYNVTFKMVKPILHVLNLFYFGSRFDLFSRSNLFPTESFSYTIQRRLLKCFTLRKFITSTGAWYNHMLVRFMSNCTGRRVYLKLNPHIENSLTFEDHVQCLIWEGRVHGFQKILGPKIFIEESLRIILIALKYKDPTFLINWIRTMLYRMSFWKYRTLFRYLKFVIRDLFEPNFAKFGLRGFKVRLKGKISVAGNARTRTLMMRIGQTSHSKFNNKVAHSFTLVNSFTGVMGFNLWIFF